MEGWLEKNILGDGSSFKLFIDEGSIGAPHHWHEEIEIIYMIKGGVRCGVNRKVYNLSEGDILIIGSGDIHYFYPLLKPGKRLVIQFGLSIFDDALGGKNESKKVKSVFAKAKKASSQWEENIKRNVEKHIRELVDENNRKDSGYILSIKARLYDIVVLLFRYIPEDEETDAEEDSHKESLKRLESIFDYVSNNYGDQIYLDDVSKIAGFSTYHFTRFFKKNTGITFNKYLSNYRITKAEWLLVNSDDNITQIAYKTGFTSIKTFNKVFKELKGCPPTQYRKEQ